MFCNVGFAEEKICQSLNECLNKGYVQKDKILFKHENNLSIIHVLEKRKSIIHCVVEYMYRSRSAKFRGTYCVKP